MLLKASRQLLVLLVCLVASLALAQRYEWRDVEQTVTIQADGRVVVVDTRTLWTDGTFGDAFICFDLSAGQSVTMLPLTGAIGAGPPAYAYTQPCAAGTELVIRNAERVSERRLRFAYVLDGTLDPYADVVQWYWNLVQLDHPPIIGYHLSVRTPGPMQGIYDAYVHRYSNLEDGRIWLADDRSRLTVDFDRVPPGDGVEVRFLMAPALFDTVGDENALTRLLEEEGMLIIDLDRDDD